METRGGPGAGVSDPPRGLWGLAAVRVRLSVQEVVELPVLHPEQQGLDLGPGVDQGGAVGETRVADGDRTALGQLGEFDAVTRGAVAALAPVRAGDVARADSVEHVLASR